MRELTKSLVLIVWNEIAGCRADVPRLPRNGFIEVIAIDGGSKDGTVEFLVENGIPVFRQRVKSLNAAYAEAVERARGEAVVVFFPKGTIDPMAVARISAGLDLGSDMVIASRNIAGAANEEDKNLLKPRKWGVVALSHFASVVWRREGPKVRDVLHGVKGFTKKAYREMGISSVGVTVDLEMVVRSYRLRIPRIEIPVSESLRLQGETKFKIWPTAKRLAAFLIRELFTSKSRLP